MSQSKLMPFSAINFPLHGSRLIEASAGTGKTWSIAALYVRLILGHGEGLGHSLNPSEILVMTFTRAATKELSDRIRARLLEAARYFRGELSADNEADQFLQDLRAAYSDYKARNLAAHQLAQAAEGMDDAAIYTIDAWCQRMLREHAFDSGSLFDESLVSDEASLQKDAIQDYWRQQCYPLECEGLIYVLDIWKNVDELISDMKSLLEKITTFEMEFLRNKVPAQTINGSLKEMLTSHQDKNFLLKSDLEAQLSTLDDWDAYPSKKNASDWNGNKINPEKFKGWIKVIKDWAKGNTQTVKPPLTDAALNNLTSDGLRKARNKNAKPLGELPEVFNTMQKINDEFNQLPKIQEDTRIHAVSWISTRLIELKRQSGKFGFADMLNRLDKALDCSTSAKSESLRNSIVAQFPVAMIDEFQDTSPIQYRIFNKIYKTESDDPKSALLLIGDPKQSIYGFKGSDIYNYLQARRATEGRHYSLDTNHRSTEELVSITNHWFTEDLDKRPNGTFMFGGELPFKEVSAKGRSEKLVDTSGVVPAMTLVYDVDLLDKKDESQQKFAEQCTEQIVTWLNCPKTGFQHIEKDEFKKIRPADIAVLVRTGTEAELIRKALNKRQVASVYLSDRDSIFKTSEAKDLLRWLRAVAMPQDVRLVRAGLATAMMGLTVEELGRLASDDELFDLECEKLRALRSVWQTQGVLAMLRQSLHVMELTARWLYSADQCKQPDGERKLTNYLHLAELLQNASSRLDGEQSLIRWLLDQIEDETASNDENIVRLESDANLVKIITIHKSKGLEYPIVCLPFACSFRKVERRFRKIIHLEEAGVQTPYLTFNDEQLKRADKDRLREDVRLLYVALTRARHALWVGFFASDQTHNSAVGCLLGWPKEGKLPAFEPQKGSTEAELKKDKAAFDEKISKDMKQKRLDLLESFSGESSDMVLKPFQDVSIDELVNKNINNHLSETEKFETKIDRSWSIGSFSSLSKKYDSVKSQMSGMDGNRSTEDNPLENAEPESNHAPQFDSVTAGNWHSFPKGAKHGDFLHDQLEWLAKDKFKIKDNDNVIDKLRDQCNLASRTDQADAVVTWLTAVTKTKLRGPNVALNELENVFPEMEFWLPADQFDNKKLDRLCLEFILKDVQRAELRGSTLHGMLKGFIDLVFEHDGKYWILDYKSNSLGLNDTAYSKTAMNAAMAEHRYDAQAAIYMLALHRILQLRLPEYKPEIHLGGAVYLFLRGINGPEKGVCLIPYSAPLIKGLEKMLEELPA